MYIRISVYIVLFIYIYIYRLYKYDFSMCMNILEPYIYTPFYIHIYMYRYGRPPTNGPTSTVKDPVCSTCSNAFPVFLKGLEPLAKPRYNKNTQKSQNPKTQKPKNPKIQKPKNQKPKNTKNITKTNNPQTQASLGEAPKKFGLLDFWTLGFLTFGFWGFVLFHAWEKLDKHTVGNKNKGKNRHE